MTAWWVWAVEVVQAGLVVQADLAAVVAAVVVVAAELGQVQPSAFVVIA